MPEFRKSTRDGHSSRWQPEPSGFSFDNIHRNSMIEEFMKVTSQSCSNKYIHNNAAYVPAARKTGTTVVGITYKGGVVLGADTRETSGDEIVNKCSNKIHYLAPNIYCCAAGTAADADKTTELISSELELHQMDTGGCQSRVITACTMLKRRLYRYQGYLGAAVIIGGCDLKGPHVYQVNQHGSTGKLPYTTMGSGSLAAMSVFETEWMEDLSEIEAVDLVKRATLTGILNDLGSGSSVDTCVIRTDGTVTINKGAIKPNKVGLFRDSIKRSERLIIKNGTTSVLKSVFVAHKGPNVDNDMIIEIDT